MNEVASPCCGSCKKAGYNSGVLYCGVSHFSVAPYDSCPEKRPMQRYEPLAPIPLIDIPGVREMVERAYRDGVKDGHFYRFDKPRQLAKEYIKSLED